MTDSEAHYRKMTETPVSRLILNLGIPTTISMLITSIYNMADTYFVGTLGESAQAATNAASIQTHGSSRFSTVRGIFSLSPFTRQVTRSAAAVSAHSFPLDKAEKLGAYEPLKRRISTVGIHAASNGEKK